MGLERIFEHTARAGVLSLAREEQIPLFPPDEEQLDLPLPEPAPKK